MDIFKKYLQTYLYISEILATKDGLGNSYYFNFLIFNFSFSFSVVLNVPDWVESFKM